MSGELPKYDLGDNEDAPIEGLDKIGVYDSPQSISEHKDPFENAPIPPVVKSFLNDYLAVAKKLLLSPVVFFREMDKEGGLLHPLKFAAVNCVISALLSGIVSLQFFHIPGLFFAELMQIFIASGVAFGLSKAMGGKGSFEATLKIYAYSSILRIVAAIPLGWLVSLVYGIFISFYGLKEVQRLGSVQTATIIILTGFLMTVISIAKFMHIF